MISFRDGYYDCSEKMFIKGNVGYNFPDREKCRKKYFEVDNFMRQILPDDVERGECLRAVASCLYGERPTSLYILRGDGENGKTMFQRLCRSALGELCKSSGGSLLTERLSFSWLESLKDCKQCWINDFEGVIKKMNVRELTSGDQLTLDNRVVYPPKFTIFMDCNSIPEFDDLEGLMRLRRVRVFEFVTRFVDNPSGPNEMKRDPNLLDKIDGWGPAFMCMLLEYV